jgi:mono/diheme cytochrome c family protein
MEPFPRSRGAAVVIRRIALISSCLLVASGMWWRTPPLAAAAQLDRAKTTPQSDARHAAVINQYCVTCHSARLKSGGLVLEKADFTNVAGNAEVWEKVTRKLRMGAMPPLGAPRPDRAASDALAGWLETELDRAAADHPNPGRALVHRLNRTEYGNAIRDLLAVDIGDVATLLPPDDSAYGFDTIADFLGVPRVLLERYLNAAGRISALAVGDRDIAPGSDTFLNRQDLSQDQHLPGLPFGTVGGMASRYTFPVDAEYTFQAKLFTTNVGETRGLEYNHQLVFTVDGKQVFNTTIGPPAPNATSGGRAGDGRADDGERIRNAKLSDNLQVTVPVPAGPHTVGVAFVQRSRALDARKMQPYLRSSFDTYDATGVPHLESLTIKGPFKITGVGDTPSRQRIFVCRPANVAAEEACAGQILSTLVRRAYRMPVDAGDLARVMDFYHAARKDDGSFDAGIQSGLQRILASPKFVMRSERDPIAVPPAAAYRLSDVELATRLSFFLWSSIPDDELLRVASQGRLSRPAVLARQVQRMLADPRSEALVKNFAGQWLQLRNLRRVVPDPDLFPDFDDNLRQGFQREAELLFQSVMQEDRNVVDLLTADYTFVNERLAKHYKIPFVYGEQFRRVPVTADERKGLLGKGAVLLVTSNADRTSPVVRGKWILDNLLGMPPPPPPANVPPLKENGERTKPLTMREQMEEHRANAACASCHKLMDPIGFAMENFDAVGSWRTMDAGGPIDAAAQLFDGTKIDGVVALRTALASHPDVFVRTVSENLMTYALGRGLESYDMPSVRRIVRDAAGHENRFSSIVMGIVTSTPFQMRMKGPALPPPETPVISSASR